MLSAEVCTSADEFAALASEWDRLHGRCSAATPFQTHAWLHSWWRAYGGHRNDRGLRVVLVRRRPGHPPHSQPEDPAQPEEPDRPPYSARARPLRTGRTASPAPDTGAVRAVPAGELVAAAAMLRVWRPLPVLVPLGGAISDFSDVLLDDAYAAQAASVLAEALAEAAGGAVVDFREVRPGAAMERVYACWPGPRRVLPDSCCLELPAMTMDEMAAWLPPSRGQRLRKKLRKLAALGVVRRVVPPAEVPRALRVLLDLHRAQWEGRGRKVTAEHLRPRFAAHLECAVSAMTERGTAVVTEFLLDSEVVAVDLTLLAPRLAGGYLFGADLRLRERKADLATMLMHSITLHMATRPTHADASVHAHEPAEPTTPQPPGGGRAVLSLLRGDEPYKQRWRPERVVNQRYLLARRRAAAPLTVTACAAMSKNSAKRLVKAVLRTRDRYRAQRGDERRTHLGRAGAAE